MRVFVPMECILVMVSVYMIGFSVYTTFLVYALFDSVNTLYLFVYDMLTLLYLVYTLVWLVCALDH